MSVFFVMFMLGLVCAVVAVHILNKFVGGVHHTSVDVARVSLFVTTWTAITVGIGMRKVTGWVRRLSQTITKYKG